MIWVGSNLSSRTGLPGSSPTTRTPSPMTGTILRGPFWVDTFVYCIFVCYGISSLSVYCGSLFTSFALEPFSPCLSLLLLDSQGRCWVFSTAPLAPVTSVGCCWVVFWQADGVFLVLPIARDLTITALSLLPSAISSPSSKKNEKEACLSFWQEVWGSCKRWKPVLFPLLFIGLSPICHSGTHKFQIRPLYGGSIWFWGDDFFCAGGDCSH